MLLEAHLGLKAVTGRKVLWQILGTVYQLLSQLFKLESAVGVGLLEELGETIGLLAGTRPHLEQRLVVEGIDGGIVVGGD